jgi:hypothetical protein
MVKFGYWVVGLLFWSLFATWFTAPFALLLSCFVVGLGFLLTLGNHLVVLAGLFGIEYGFMRSLAFCAHFLHFLFGFAALRFCLCFVLLVDFSELRFLLRAKAQFCCEFVIFGVVGSCHRFVSWSLATLSLLCRLSLCVYEGREKEQECEEA